MPSVDFLPITPGDRIVSPFTDGSGKQVLRPGSGGRGISPAAYNSDPVANLLPGTILLEAVYLAYLIFRSSVYIAPAPLQRRCLQDFFFVLQAHRTNVKALRLPHWGGFRGTFQALFLALQRLKSIFSVKGVYRRRDSTSIRVSSGSSGASNVMKSSRLGGDVP